MGELWVSEGQSALQVAELLLAFVLSSAIGLERELRQKSAGLRTHTLVGVGAALFMLVSKYGFYDVLSEQIMLDPSRVAAQVASGIGFIGGGLIFVRRDVVSGLTTAASIWLTAAVGMAAGSGLALLAVCATLVFFIAVPGYSLLMRVLPQTGEHATTLRLAYLDGRGVLRSIVSTCTQRGFSLHHLAVHRDDTLEPGIVAVTLRVQGRGGSAALAAALVETEGVTGVATDPLDSP